MAHIGKKNRFRLACLFGLDEGGITLLFPQILVHGAGDEAAQGNDKLPVAFRPFPGILTFLYAQYRPEFTVHIQGYHDKGLDPHDFHDPIPGIGPDVIAGDKGNILRLFPGETVDEIVEPFHIRGGINRVNPTPDIGRMA